MDRIRDGKSFVSRQVRAIQHGRTIFMCMVSFAHQEEGLNYQISEPEYPPAESLKNEAELIKQIIEFIPENVRASFTRDRHVEIRPVNPQNPFQPQPLKHRLMRTISVRMTVLLQKSIRSPCIRLLLLSILILP